MFRERTVTLENGIRLLLVYLGHILGHEWREIDAYGRVMANGIRVTDTGQYDKLGM